LLRGSEAEPFTRPVVKRASDGVAALLRERGHAGAFGHVLADQAVGVFIGAALPRVMRRREVERDARGALELYVVVELGAVVGGDGFESLWMTADETQRTAIRMFFRSRSELADREVASLAIDDRDEAMVIALA